MKLIMSRHALEQARERGISITEIKNCIQRGAKSMQGKKIIAMHMHIKVVYRRIGDCDSVITAMIRGEKNGK